MTLAAPVPASAKPPGVFSPLTALLMVLVGAFALSAFVVLSAYAPDLQTGQDGGAHALSRSGIGFAALPQLLRLEGRPVLVIRRPPPLRSGNASSGVLVLTPGPQHESAALQAIPFNGPILIVLPKWDVVLSPTHTGWVRRQGLLPPEIGATILSGYDPDAQVTRREGTTRPALRLNGEGVFTPGPVANLQTLRGRAWLPVMVDEAGAAVLVRFAKSNIYVLSDPDLMNNQGLHDLETARTAQAILAAVQQREGPVMFDVSLNGFRSSTSLLRLMFDPPFLAVTLCLAAAGVLMGIHAMARFGPAEASGRVFAFGGQALADNTAELIRLAGREASMGPRYAVLVRGLAAKALAAPRDLAPAALTEFLDRMAQQRGAADRLSGLTDIAGGVQRRGDLLTIAQRLHRWRLEMTREH